MDKIYLKNSDKARLASKRVRIVRETNPRRPDEYEDLVFEVTEDASSVPSNALKTWKLDRRGLVFFTTAERCKKMVSSDPSYWTPEKLDYFAKVEKKIWENWFYGYVYGFVVEVWDNASREWKHESSLWGMYGSEELIYNLKDEVKDKDVIICLDSEEMKYEFDNTEKRLNEFE